MVLSETSSCIMQQLFLQYLQPPKQQLPTKQMKTLKPQTHVTYQHKFKPFKNIEVYRRAFQTIESYSFHLETTTETPQFCKVFGLSLNQNLKLAPQITSDTSDYI